MLKAIKTLPEQFGWGWNAAESVCQSLTPHGFDRILLCGMGGSAFPGELLKLGLGANGERLTVFRGYLPPRHLLSASTLVIGSSFSGNTAETLSAFQHACEYGCKGLAVTTGGELAARCQASGIPIVHLPRPWVDFQPRAATGIFVGALARIFHQLELAVGLQDDLRTLGAFLSDFTVDHALLSSFIDALHERSPVICSAREEHGIIAKVAKIKINENSKMAAFWNALPEMNHNELEGFTCSGNGFAVFLLESPGLHEVERRRIEATKEVLSSRGVPVVVLPSWSAKQLEHAFTQLLYFDYLSLHLAVRNGVEANPVPTIEAFKKLL